MNQLTSILVCVDFSESSKTALAQAGRIARWNGAALHVVHVILPRVVEDLAAVRGVSREEMAASLTSAVDEDLRKLEAGVESVPPDTQHHVRIGAGFEEIRAVAREVNADLAVMGVVGADESTAGAGSLATKCVRKLPTRVLLVHSEHRSAFERVVACVDFSETSKQAIEQAVRVAKSDRAALYVLHVFKGPWHVLHYRAATPESSPQFRKQYTDRLRDELESFFKPFAADAEGVEVHCELLDHANYGRGIVEFASENQADLVVLGTEGHANLRYLFLGSTAERVLREVPCSVLTVKPARFSLDAE